jgi:hypothetical protein
VGQLAEADVAATETVMRASIDVTTDPGLPPSPALPCAAALALVSAAALLLWPLQADADTLPEYGSIGIKHLRYDDSQPGAQRIRVDATALELAAPLAQTWLIGATVVTDSISGASPAYHNSYLVRLRERRNAVDLAATHYGQDVSSSAGISVSSESDYLSRAMHGQFSHSSADRNTVWTVGAAFSRDVINPSHRIVTDQRKQVADLLVSVTQVWTSNDLAQLNLVLSRGRGYFSDPYKLVDQRPPERDSIALLGRWNHAAGAHGTLRLSYRYYADTWGIRSHTAIAELAAPLTPSLTVTPSLRIYDQSRANFYVDAGPPGQPFAPNPPPGAMHFSEDQRLSSFGALTAGLKLTWQIDPDWLADLKFERYEQRAGWRPFGHGSPDLLPFRARSLQLGLSRRF